MFQEYIDFEIQISPLSESRCAVSVSGPGGDASGTLALPTNDPVYLDLAQRLQQLDTDEAVLADLGQILFQALFQGPIRDVYTRSQGRLGASQGLRLRFNIAASAAAAIALPWEFLYDPDQGPLALLDVSVSRYLALSVPIPQLQAPLPLRVLLTAAQTVRAATAEHEIAEVAEALAGLGRDVEIAIVPHLTRAELQRRLREGFHIWHFVGYGGTAADSQTGQLYLEGAAGDADRLSATELNILLHRSGVRLVVLDACANTRLATDSFRTIAPALMRAQVPAVVAMQFSAPQAVTRAFAGEFYRTLAEGLPLDACVTEGRKAIMAATGLSTPDWGIPIVYTRAADGKLFSPPEAAAAPPPADIDPPPEPARPPEISHFIGRAEELAALSADLASTHMAIITGMSGVGKTSLAAALARQTSDPRKIFWHTFHQGEGLDALIWDLAGFLAWNGQPDVWRMIQSARQSGGQPPPAEVLFDYLLQTLREQEYVLCFDDFQYVDEDPLVERFITRLRAALQTNGVALIVTSRRVPNLTETRPVTPIGGLRLEDIQRLLAQRSIVLDAALAEQLVSITGGNAQLLTLSFTILQKGRDPARALARLAESEDIERYLLREVDAGLSEAERGVMGAVAALLGYGGTRDAIEALLDGANARRALSHLTQRHLLVVSEGDETREYGQHALVQAFYYEQLSRREREALHRRAGAYYESEEPDQLRAASHYERAGDTPRAATIATADVWSLINRGQAKPLCRLLERFEQRQLAPELWAAARVALGTAYPFAGAIGLARQVHEETWRFLAGLPDAPLVRRLKAQVSAGLGTLIQYDDPEQALERLRAGLGAIGPAELPEEAAALQILVGNVLIAIGDYPAALEAVQAGRALLADQPSQLQVRALLNLGLIAYHQDDLALAKEHTRRALAMSEQLHDTFRRITAIGNLALFDDVAGDWPAAAAGYRRTIELAEQLGATTQRVRQAQNLGLLAINMGDDAAAIEALAGALALARENNLREHELVCQFGLADLHLRRGEIDQAAPLLAEVERLSEATGSRDRLQEVYRYWASVHLARGDAAAAQGQVERALALARALGNTYDEGLCLRVQGQILHRRGDPAGAAAAFEQSLALLDDDPYESARTQAQWGLALRESDQPEPGAQLLRAAREAFARLGARRDLAEAERWLAAP